MHIYNNIAGRTKRNSHLAKVSDSVLFRQSREAPQADLADIPDESVEDPLDVEPKELDIKLSSPSVPIAVAGKIEVPKEEAAAKDDESKEEVPAPKVENSVKPQASSGNQSEDSVKQESPVVSQDEPNVPKKVESPSKDEPAPANESVKVSPPISLEASDPVNVPPVPESPLDPRNPPVAPGVAEAPAELETDPQSEESDSDGVPDQSAPVNPLPQDPTDELYGVGSYKHSSENLCRDSTMPLGKETIKGVNYYSFNFSMLVATQHDEGLYNVYFHACPNYYPHTKIVSFNVSLNRRFCKECENYVYPF